MAFSPAVSIVEPASLLLEISGSLRYFGGLDLLEAGLDTCIAQTGYTHVAACAPTPRAAQWLATAGTRATVQNLAELMSVLAPLPVACLGWPEKECCVLDQMGIETLGDCFRLPRHGFARRFGRHRLRELDEGLGRVAQALLVYNPPVDFGECIEPDAEIDDSVTVLKWVTPVLDRLEIFLKQHQAGVSELRLKLGHSRQADTCLKVGLLQPATRAHTLSELLEIRLEHTGLAACVTRIEVQADIRQCYVPEQVSLFAGWQAGRDESVPELVQRLCSRLGEASVHRVGFVAEHRPEWAWQSFAGPAISAAGQADDRQEASASYSGMRPVWMLESPVALTESAAGPAYRGPLCLESGPERIETGWWDGSDIRRDYFLASNSMGERLWVYRELRSGCWYLHGFFG
jgi:protein ImuB